MAKKMAKDVAAVPAMDKDWQAESDADTLIRAEEIAGDAKRYDKALAIVKKRKTALDDVLADEPEERAELAGKNPHKGSAKAIGEEMLSKAGK